MADITTIAISELNPTNASADDLIEVSHNNSGRYVSMRTSLTSVGTLLNNTLEYASALQTTDKTIIGAINELKAMIEALGE